MPCTEEQWKDLRPYLDKYGIPYQDIGPFTRYQALVNDLLGESNCVSNILFGRRLEGDRVCSSEFSIPFFLQNCGVVEYQNMMVTYQDTEVASQDESASRTLIQFEPMKEKTKKPLTVLVHYKEFVDGGHALLDGTYVDRSKVIEVSKLTDLNDMFQHITKVDILISNE